MNQATTTLHAVLQHAQNERDAATAQLTQLCEAQARLLQQQEQLGAYRRDYHARWTAQFRIAGAAEVVQHYQGFVERLNHALEQLTAQLELATRQTDSARALLLEREMRVLAVRKLIERRDSEWAQRQSLHEQKQTDERAARLAWQRVPAMGALGASGAAHGAGALGAP